MLLSKGAGLQDPATKAFQPGVFVLYATKITWQPDLAQVPAAKELHVGLISVTNTQRAKTRPMLRLVAGTSDYTFQFDSLLDRDAAVDGLTKAKELLNQAPASQAKSSQRAPSASTASASTSTAKAAGAKPATSQVAGLPTAAQKKEWLKADAELGERYNALVAAAGVLSEEEFWQGVVAERLKAAAAAAAAGGGAATGSGAAAKSTEQPAEVLPLPNPPDVPEQQRGLSNAMFQVPVEQDGRSVAMRFTLTPEVIAMVFAEKPHVRRAYEKNVPNQMSEKDFWTRYIKHEMAKEERRKRLVAAADKGGSAADGQMTADAAPLEHTSLFSDGTNDGASTSTGADGSQQTSDRRVKQKLATADPTVNLAADAADGFSQGFGLLHAANKEPATRGGLRVLAEDLAKDINRHATVVLAGCHILDSKPDSTSQKPSGSKAAAETAGKWGGGPAGQDAAAEEQLDELAAQRVRQYASGLDDLKQQPKPKYEQLKLKRREPPQSTAAEASAPVTRSEQQGNWQLPEPAGSQGITVTIQVLQHLDPNKLNPTPISSQQAFLALLDVCGISVESSGPAGSGHVTLSGISQQPPDALLAPALLSKLRTQVKVVSDVSRHFWTCMPPKNQEQYEKAERLAQHVDKVLWPEAEATLRTANTMGGPQRPAIRALLAPAQSMMEAVLARFDQEKESRHVYR